MDNNYSNIIAPSDGVRRFLCKTSVLIVSILTAVFCACAFRMNMLEARTLGSTLRSNMLYAAYIMLPLGLLTASIFARVKSMGLAFSMISLLVATAAAFMLLLNSLASLLREGRLLGISGSLLEFLTFGAFFALLVNLVMSCMEFRLQPVIGTIGSLSSILAMIVTSIRTMLSFSALSFAWKSEFDWTNLGKLVDTDKLRYHAEWIFRSIPRGNASALHSMFMLRFYERISACVFYAIIIMIFMKYQKEMRAFNKLLAHAGEYVEIPTARIYQSIFGSGARNDSEPVVQTPKTRSGSSVRSRLRELSNMAKAKEQGMDITDLADEYDTRRENENNENRYSSEAGDLNYSEDDELTEEERFIMESRRRLSRSDGSSDENPRQRRRDEFGDDNRPRQRRRDEFGDDDRPRQRRRDDPRDDDRPRQRRRDEFGDDDRPRQRRRDEFGDDDRPRQRRRDDSRNDDRPRQRRRPQERELTDQEKYLMEERRKRQSRMNPDGRNERRSNERSGF